MFGNEISRRSKKNNKFHVLSQIIYNNLENKIISSYDLTATLEEEHYFASTSINHYRGQSYTKYHEDLHGALVFYIFLFGHVGVNIRCISLG